MQKIAGLISDDIIERISEKISEIEKSTNLSNFDVSTIVNKITDFTTIEHVSIQNDLWKDIAKLSIDFYLDFDYYKQFIFQSKFSCKEYHDALKSLGFKEIDGFWKSCSKPSKTLVINYVVQSCIYRAIMMKMNEGDCVDANLDEVVITTNDTTELLDCCPFCDENLNGVHNCESCNATAGEIENLRNQRKVIENIRNQIDDNDESVAGVVENDVSYSEHVDNNTNENTLIINKNSKLISNINFSEENKQKINRENENSCENVDIDREFAIVNVATVDEKSNNWICKRRTRNNLSENKGIANNNNNNKDNNVEKEGMIDSWNCWFEKCKKINDGNVKYCTDCGLDKSANRERGAAVEMKKSGEKQQVWICYACYHINNDLTKSFCQRCGVSKVDHKDKINENAEILDSYEVIESDNNDINKWKCRQCESVNGDELLLCCKQCKSSRLEIWICKHCTMRNQISDDNCAACGKENENKIIKYCSKCKRGEIIYDNLCRDCLRARDETWICWYRFCGNKNIGNVNYCKNCGLDRDANKIDIGAPMLRCTGDVPHEIWICDKCFNINDISCSYCQHRTCHNKNKYKKWCYKCKYRYNHESSKNCKICGGKLY